MADALSNIFQYDNGAVDPNEFPSDIMQPQQEDVPDAKSRLARVKAIRKQMGQIEGFGTTMKKEFTGMKAAEKIPIAGGAVSAAKMAELIAASKRLQDPKHEYAGSTKDLSFLERVKKNRELMKRTGSVSPFMEMGVSREQDVKIVEDYIDEISTRRDLGGKIAKGMSVLPTWMIEFGLTGGAAQIGKESTKKGLQKLLKEHTKSKAGQVALKAAGWTGGGITRATVGLAPRSLEAGVENKLQSILRDEEENWATSLAKGWGDTVIESMSEEAGGAITKGLGLPLKKMPFAKRFIPALQAKWSQKTGGSVQQFTKKFLSKGGYSNIIGEIGEERLGTIMRSIAGVEDYGAGPDASMKERLVAGLKHDFNYADPDVRERQIAEAAVLGLPMAGQMAADIASPGEFKMPPKTQPEAAQVKTSDIQLLSPATTKELRHAENYKGQVELDDNEIKELVNEGWPLQSAILMEPNEARKIMKSFKEDIGSPGAPLDKSTVPDTSIKDEGKSHSIANTVATTDKVENEFRALTNDGSIFQTTNVQKAIADFDGAFRWGLEQNQSAFNKRVEQFPRDVREAATLRIQYADNPELLDRYKGKAKGKVANLIKLSENLTPEAVAYAKELQDEYANEARELQDAGLLDATVEHYVNQIWIKSNKHGKKGNKARKFGGKLAATKHRVITGGYLQGIMDMDLDPLTLDSAQLLKIYKDSALKAKQEQLFLTSVKDMVNNEGEKILEPISAVTNNPNYVLIDHPSLKKYAYKGKTGNAVLIEKMPLAVHRDAKKDIEAVVNSSLIKQLPVMRQMLTAASAGKSALLGFSFFHHTALAKTAMFYGVNPMPIGPNNHISGLDLIETEDPIVKMLVEKGGLTLSASDKVGFAKRAGGTPLHTDLARTGPQYIASIAKMPFRAVKTIKQSWDRLLWDRYYTGLKAMSAKIEYHRNLHRFPKLSSDDIAIITSRDVNNNFGGLNWQRMGIPETYIDLLRLAMLAPDWTLSNFSFFAESAKIGDVMRWAAGKGKMPKPPGMQGTSEFYDTSKGASRYMSKVLVTGITVTAAVNYALWGQAFPQPPEDRKKHWYKIMLPLKSPEGQPYYLDLLGHFMEPWKAVTETEQWGSGKASFLWRQLIEQYTGKNWRGNNIGDLEDLVDGHLYRSKFKPVPQGGFLGVKRIPNRTIHALASFIPIPIKQTADVMSGEKESVQIISTTGIPVVKGKGPLQIEYEQKQEIKKEREKLLEQRLGKTKYKAYKKRQELAAERKHKANVKAASRRVDRSRKR